MNHNHISYLRYALSVACTCLLVSCGAKRMTMPKTDTPRAVIAVDQVEALRSTLAQQGESWTALRGSLKASVEGRGKSFSARVSFSAVRGQGFRLSVTPFPLIEAARLWFSVDGITLVDMINGRYAQESYEALSDRLGFAVTYEQIESIFLGQVFVPERGRSLEALERLGVLPEVGGSIRLEGQSRSYPYLFVVSPEAQLERFDVLSKGGRELRFRASYGQYTPSLGGQRSFPTDTSFALYRSGSDGGEELGRLGLEWSRLTPVDPQEVQVEPVIKDKYERIDLGQILKLLDKLDK